MNYNKEQGHADGDDTPLSADLKPWLRREWDMDLFVSEFPYFQYAGVDHPVEDDPRCEDWMADEWGPDDPAEIPDSIRKSGPYRTDLVGLNINRRALRTRIKRIGHATSLNGSQSTKRRRRRTYLTFVGDGPMTREYWEQNHGGDGELRTYGSHSASRAFGWLKKRGFLREVRSGWGAVDIPLHIHGRAHAFELKLDRNEWETALEQASRADVFADYRWVVYDSDTADRALANADQFRSEAVGLITLDPDGCEVHVWAEQCSPTVDRDLLDRYNVERWDLNERALKALNTRYEKEREPGNRADRWVPGVPDILGEINHEDIRHDANPRTVHGGDRTVKRCQKTSEDTTDHKPLSAFADGSEGGGE